VTPKEEAKGEKTAENRGGGPKKKKRDSERVGRKTEAERETIVLLREKGEDERKETAGYF